MLLQLCSTNPFVLSLRYRRRNRWWLLRRRIIQWRRTICELNTSLCLLVEVYCPIGLSLCGIALLYLLLYAYLCEREKIVKRLTCSIRCDTNSVGEVDCVVMQLL